MNKSLIAALIAAAAIVPASAFAQDDNHKDHKDHKASQSGQSGQQGSGQGQHTNPGGGGQAGQGHSGPQTPGGGHGPAVIQIQPQQQSQQFGGGHAPSNPVRVQPQVQQPQVGGHGPNNGGGGSFQHGGPNRPAWSNNWRQNNRYDWRGYRNQNRNIFRLPRYSPPRGYGYGYNRFSIGAVLAGLLFSQQYWINDPFYYRLPPAYGPYRWVRYYNDALLVDIYTGQVVDTEYGIFW